MHWVTLKLLSSSFFFSTKCPVLIKLLLLFTSLWRLPDKVKLQPAPLFLQRIQLQQLLIFVLDSINGSLLLIFN